MLKYFIENEKKNLCQQEVEKTTSKSCILYGSWEVFFLHCPDCPKQPGTSFPFYRFFYATLSGRTSVFNTFFDNFRKKRRKNFKRSSRPPGGPVLVRTVMSLHLTNVLLTANLLNRQPQWSSTEGTKKSKLSM